MAVRRPITGRDKNALFLSTRNERISRSGVHALVKKHLAEAGLDATQYSSHKLDVYKRQLFGGGDDEEDQEEKQPFDWGQASDDLVYNLLNDAPLLRNAAGLLGLGDQMCIRDRCVSCFWHNRSKNSTHNRKEQKGNNVAGYE